MPTEKKKSAKIPERKKRKREREEEKKVSENPKRFHREVDQRSSKRDSPIKARERKKRIYIVIEGQNPSERMSVEEERKEW